MQPAILDQTRSTKSADFNEAWQMVLGQLRSEMSRAMYETWVQPLQPISYREKVFTVGAYNPYARDWVENRLRGRVAQLLEGFFNESVQVKFTVANGFYNNPHKQKSKPSDHIKEEKGVGEEQPESTPEPAAPSTSRKIMLQRAYGSERAKLIQPERGLFLTLYMFYEWLPLLGHSAFATILAARSLCYWNPMTGELRNVIETEMSELARRAAVSVRTIKDVLTSELVKKYFLRYRVRRVMTPNGVRTAGISLQVRMDDPLTPSDQELSKCPESEIWYSPDFEDESEDEE
jgi:hypothetical protein